MATETSYTPATSAEQQTERTERHEPTTYERYIRTGELLALQKAPDQWLHPDELTFQVVHQTFELWWKVTAQQLSLATAALDSDQFYNAAQALKRAVAAQAVVMTAMRQLELVAPVDFLTLRPGLGDGNGGDSPGFHAILRVAPALWETFTHALDRQSLALLDLYLTPSKHPLPYMCAEALTDFDEQFHLFRAAHLKLAERHLGPHALGTGGTPVPSLEHTLRVRLFPALWQARDHLLDVVQKQQETAKSAPAASSL